jgi:hypothetical protein
MVLEALMSVLRRAVLLAGLAGAASAAQAATVVVDFNTLTPTNGNIGFQANPYQEDGFRLDAGTGSFISYHGAHGSGSVELLNLQQGAVTTLTRIGGGVFDLLSIHLDTLLAVEDPPGPVPATVLFTAQISGGGSVQQTFELDAFETTLETFSFNSSFQNLVSVTWQQNTAWAYVFDNITLVVEDSNGSGGGTGNPGGGTRVPEPATLVLLAGGLMGLGAVSRRRRSA